MKLSISLPDTIAHDIKALSKESERSVSYWLQKAWHVAKPHLMQDKDQLERQKKKAMRRLKSLKGSFRADYGDVDSVTLAHRAFEKIRK